MTQQQHRSILNKLSLEDVEKILPRLNESDKARLLEELEVLLKMRKEESARSDFMSYVKQVYPGYIAGRHHKIMAEAFQRVANGTCKRLIINMPPRHMKSIMGSYLFPSWYLGKFPKKKIIQCSVTAELAVGFGRQVRNLVDSPEYQTIFPDVSLRTDSKAAGRWNTNQNGEYYAIGVGGSVTGKGGDVVIIDDPHDEQQAVAAETNPEIYDKVYEWFTSGPRQRLQPGGALVVIMTRWSKRDLTAQILKAAAQRDGDSWEVIELPALFDNDKPLWPEFWSKDALTTLRNELPNAKWQAQYQQSPTSDVSAIVKREWWQIWEEEEPPKIEFCLQSWDTAFLKTQRSDYSACTTWGVFYRDDDAGRSQANIILLNAIKERLEFPELKQRAIREYKEWSPDSVVIEAKAAGAPLIFELRRMGVPVQDYTPSKGSDKIARLNSVADIFASGRVWAPRKHWAEEVIEEVGSFPSSEHDDLTDTVSQALMRFRQGGFITLHTDEQDDDIPEFRRKREYY